MVDQENKEKGYYGIGARGGKSEKERKDEKTYGMKEKVIRQ